MEIVGGRGGEKLHAHNLRDLLRIKEEDRHSNLNQSTSSNSSGGVRNNTTGLTLQAVLSGKRRPPPPVDEPLQRVQSNRTLLDIIREDQTSGLGGGRRDGRRSWLHLKDKIRLRHRVSGSGWSSTAPIPASDAPLNNSNNHRFMMMTPRPSIRLNSGESTHYDISTVPGPSSHRNPSLAVERANGRFEHTSSLPRRQLIIEANHHHHHEEDEPERSGGTVEEEEGEGSTEQPARMSLMALLAETDRQMGLEGSAYIIDEDDGEEEEEEESAAAAAATGGGEYNSCCVCMVRHKGAAFIPCGHTFCRLCSRELWVQRGNCPLCNNYILEILDIF